MTTLWNAFYHLTGGRTAARRLTGGSFQGSFDANACFERARGKQGGFCPSAVWGGLLKPVCSVQMCALTVGECEHHSKYHLLADQCL